MHLWLSQKPLQHCIQASEASFIFGILLTFRTLTLESKFNFFQKFYFDENLPKR